MQYSEIICREINDSTRFSGFKSLGWSRAPSCVLRRSKNEVFLSGLVLNLYYTFTTAHFSASTGSRQRSGAGEINVYSLSIISHGPSNNFSRHTREELLESP